MLGATEHNKNNNRVQDFGKRKRQLARVRKASERSHELANTSTTREKIQKEANTTNSTVEEERHMKYEQQRYARDRANLEPK